jgi:D-lactate dehydrogenase
MKIAVFDIHRFERETLEAAASGKHALSFIDARLSEQTAVLAKGNEAVCLFANDSGSADVLRLLSDQGVRYVALRSAGFNHVDLEAAKALDLKVANVPEYSPHSVAEHTVAMILALNRKIIRANRRVMELNFSLDGLVGFDLNGKTVGIVGLGRIGAVVAKILHGFGCRILGCDIEENESLVENFNVTYVDLDVLCSQSDIITLHAPLTKNTKHLINATRLSTMKTGVMLINTSRGALLDTRAVIDFLKQRHVGYLGIDVYEEEAGLFFEDHSDEDLLQDDTIARLMTFKNVLITSHQAFLTTTALTNIAETTMENFSFWQRGESSPNDLV